MGARGGAGELVFWALFGAFALLAAVALFWTALSVALTLWVRWRDPVHRPDVEPSRDSSPDAGMAALAVELSAAGFAPVGDFIMEGPQRLLLFADAERRELAAIAAMSGTLTLSVSSCLGEGRYLTVTNRARSPVLAVAPGSTLLRRPGAGMAELLALHRARARAAPPPRTLPAELRSHLAAELRAQFELYEREGLMRRVEPAGWRLSWAGAWRAVGLALTPAAAAPGEELPGAPPPLSRRAKAGAAVELLLSLAVLGAYYMLIFRVPEDARGPWQAALVLSGAALGALMLAGRRARGAPPG